MDTRMYVMTHKQIAPIDDEMYIPIHVGRAGKANLGYLGDDTGDSISEKNSSYCELTGLYWLWKNVKCDIIGICHYRRFFVKNEQLLKKDNIEQILDNYDIIIPDSRCTEMGNIEKHYEQRHHIEDLYLCGDVIREKCPEYSNAFEVALKSNLLSMGNMWITRKKIFDQYCEWLFDILFEVERRIDFSKYDAYQGRVMGFLSERLFRVWLLQNSYRIHEEDVKMIETKDFPNDVKEMQLKYRLVKTILTPLSRLYETYEGNLNSMSSLTEDIVQKDDFNGKIPVWVCWWQGEENAPELVKVCINSIRNNIPKDKAVFRLITLDNCMEYVTFTDTIIRKFQEDKITLTHLSDLLRAELLYRYGGMWIDATYYVTDAFQESIFDKNVFYTLKYPYSIWKADITQGRWACNFLKIPEKSLFARFLMEGLWYYWEVNDSLVDYFLIDYVAALAYEMFVEVHTEIDGVSPSDVAVFELQKNLNRKYDAEKYQEWRAKTSYFKLNWRAEVQETTITQKQTFWGYLKDKDLK